MGCAGFLGTPVYWGDTPSTVGGTGGTSLVVTNTNDSGAGSFREAVAYSGGPCIITFATSGTIELLSEITITNPYTTIDGSTAPNGGICFKNAPVRIENSHDIIIRHVRFRQGAAWAATGNGDDLSIYDSYNVLVEYCSLSWATDETIDTMSTNVEIRYCIISEALSDAGHPLGIVSKGILLYRRSNLIVIHHCLFAHNRDRNPRVTAGRVRVYNNIMYDGEIHAWFAPRYNGPAYMDVVHNTFIQGPNGGVTAIGTDPSAEEWYGSKVYGYGNQLSAGMKEFPTPIYPAQGAVSAVPLTGTIEGLDETLAYVADIYVNVGATLPKRDSVDTRIITETQTGAGGYIDDPSEVGGWPDLTV